jgi:hypothetical protein
MTMTKNIPQNKEDEIIYLKKKGCERFLSMLCQQRNASNLQTNDNKAMQTNNNMRPCKSPKYPYNHVQNTLLVDDTPYKTCLNLPSNAIFVESYEYAPKKDNYLMKTLLPYLKFFHYFGLSVPTFVELYPFGAIRSIKEDDVRFRTLFEKCTMVRSTNFYKNRSTFVVSSPNIFFCSFLTILF